MSIFNLVAGLICIGLSVFEAKIGKSKFWIILLGVVGIANIILAFI